MLILGGQGSLYGAVVGAFAFVALQEIYSSMTTHWQLLLGATIIALVIFLPGGLASVAGRFKREADRQATTMTEPILVTHGLSRRFGGLMAVNDVAIELDTGHAARGAGAQRRRQDDAHQPAVRRACRHPQAASATRARTSRDCRPTGARASASAAASRRRTSFPRSPHSRIAGSPHNREFRVRFMLPPMRWPFRRCAMRRAAPSTRRASGARGAGRIDAVARRAAPARDRDGARDGARKCCCSTSRWPGWAPRKSARMVELLKKITPRSRAAAGRARHGRGLRRRRPDHGDGERPGPRERIAERDPRQPGGSTGISGRHDMSVPRP